MQRTRISQNTTHTRFIVRTTSHSWIHRSWRSESTTSLQQDQQQNYSQKHQQPTFTQKHVTSHMNTITKKIEFQSLSQIVCVLYMNTITQKNEFQSLSRIVCVLWNDYSLSNKLKTFCFLLHCTVATRCFVRWGIKSIMDSHPMVLGTTTRRHSTC